VSDDLVVTTAGRVTRVQLARAAKRNAITAGMLDCIAAAVDEAERAGSTVIVLSGEPGYFSAGADIALYSESAGDTATLLEFTERANAVCRSLASSPAIVVAVVDGVAMGGGFELVLSSDIVIASDRSRFALPEISLGLIPGWGGTQRLTSIIGAARARHAVLTGAGFDARRAHELGIVSRLVAADELDDEVESTVADLLARAPLALAAGKSAVAASGTESGYARETELLMSLFASEDGREGVSAFVEKRAPRFTGR